MMWLNSLAPTSTTDGYLRLLTSVCLAAWLLFVGTHIEVPYPAPLVEAYALPVTRIALLVLVLLSASWCPTVGILAALAYVTLGADVLFFTHGAQTLANSKTKE
jgi:hypothetical protein